MRLAYDDLERRIDAVLAQESLKAVRPDLDGTAIMALLGLAPGPVVGRAYQHLLAVRMDTGPLAPDGRRGGAARAGGPRSRSSRAERGPARGPGTGPQQRSAGPAVLVRGVNSSRVVSERGSSTAAPSARVQPTGTSTNWSAEYTTRRRPSYR